MFKLLILLACILVVVMSMRKEEGKPRRGYTTRPTR